MPNPATLVLQAALFFTTQATAQTPHPPTTASPIAPATQSPELAEAEAAITKSDWKTAQTKLDAYLQQHATDAQALFDRGYIADAQNDLPTAESFYHRAIDADPKLFEAHLSLGLLLARENKPAAARPELTAATELDPGPTGAANKARAWRALAQIDQARPDQTGPNRTSDNTQASEDLLEALKLSPETTADTLMAATIADQSGEYDTAEKAYRRVLAIDPSSAQANAGLAHILIVNKQFPEAETLLRKALESAPDNPALNAQLAATLAAQDKAEALPLLQTLHTAHPQDAAISRMLAEVLADAGDYSNSDRLYATLLAASPDDVSLLVGHGQNLIRQTHYPEAFATFTRATDLDPASPEAWSGLAFAASRTNQPAVTLHALTMRSKFLPELPSTYFLWATAFDTLHQKGQAIAYYEHFLESSAGKFPDQEWQAKQRLKLLGSKQ